MGALDTYARILTGQKNAARLAYDGYDDGQPGMSDAYKQTLLWFWRGLIASKEWPSNIVAVDTLLAVFDANDFGAAAVNSQTSAIWDTLDRLADEMDAYSAPGPIDVARGTVVELKAKALALLDDLGAGLKTAATTTALVVGAAIVAYLYVGKGK